MNDSKLLCMECGKKSETSFARSLGSGWPTHCGYTMRLIQTEADIDAAVAGIVNRSVAQSANQEDK